MIWKLMIATMAMILANPVKANDAKLVLIKSSSDNHQTENNPYSYGAGTAKKVVGITLFPVGGVSLGLAALGLLLSGGSIDSKGSTVLTGLTVVGVGSIVGGVFLVRSGNRERRDHLEWERKNSSAPESTETTIQPFFSKQPNTAAVTLGLQWNRSL